MTKTKTEQTMNTRIGSISAEGVTIGTGGIWIEGERIDKTYQPKSYSWEPQEDITAYELAQCLPALLVSIKGLVVQPEIERLPENCRRHFEEVNHD